MKPQQRSAAIIFSILSLVMIQFQNCAPAHDGIVAIDSNDVGLIDGWDSSKLQFIADSYYVKSDVDTLSIEGVCEAQEVDFKIIKLNTDGSEELLSQGQTSCQSGFFEVAMTSTKEHLKDCTELVEVEASVPADQISTSTLIRMQCF